MLTDWSLTIKNLVFPIFCQACGMRLLTEENSYFCPTCWELSPRIGRPFCTVCGRPQEGRAGFGFVDNFPCQDCRQAGETPLGRIWGAAVYTGPVAEAIKLLKFNGKKRLVGPLSGLMVSFALEEMDRDGYDALVPVPLHRVRERERGFNQSRLLARRLLEVFPKAGLRESLVRIRPTFVQSQIDNETDREANVLGAFSVCRGASLKGERVLLIDDVVTSGGTARECARVLSDAGAARVEILAAALPHSSGSAFEDQDRRLRMADRK